MTLVTNVLSQTCLNLVEFMIHPTLTFPVVQEKDNSLRHMHGRPPLLKKGHISSKKKITPLKSTKFTTILNIHTELMTILNMHGELMTILNMHQIIDDHSFYMQSMEL